MYIKKDLKKKKTHQKQRHFNVFLKKNINFFVCKKNTKVIHNRKRIKKLLVACNKNKNNNTRSAWQGVVGFFLVV